MMWAPETWRNTVNFIRSPTNAGLVCIGCLLASWAIARFSSRTGAPELSVEIVQFGILMRTIKVTNTIHEKPARIASFGFYGLKFFSKQRIPIFRSDAVIEGCCKSIPCEMPPGGALFIKTAKMGISDAYRHFRARATLESGETFWSKKSPVTVYLPPQKMKKNPKLKRKETASDEKAVEAGVKAAQDVAALTIAKADPKAKKIP